MSLNSCTKVIGDGPVITETRVVRGFSEIELGVPGEMILEESENFEIEIEAQRNIVDVIETYISGDELKIKVRDGKSIRSSEDIRIIARGKGINSLSVNGSGRISVEHPFEPLHAKLRVNGSGKIHMKALNAEDLEVRVNGSGAIEADNGSADHESLRISGSGNIYLQPVIAKRASTETSGSGNIRLHVTDELDVKISGSGDVYYEGTPAVIVSVSGSGRVIKL